MDDFQVFVVEYVPTPTLDQRVVIGLVLFDSLNRLVRLKFTADWSLVLAIDPNARVDMLACLADHFLAMTKDDDVRDTQSSPRPYGSEILYREILKMRDEYSGGIQVSSAQPLRSGNLAADFEALFRIYVGSAGA